MAIGGGTGVGLVAEGIHEETGASLRQGHWVGPYGGRVCLAFIGTAPADGADAAFDAFRAVMSSTVAKER